jgi:hypothetical protein
MPDPEVDHESVAAGIDILDRLERVEERLQPPEADVRGALDLVQDLQAELERASRADESIPCHHCQQPLTRGEAVRGDDGELYHPEHRPEGSNV